MRLSEVKKRFFTKDVSIKDIKTLKLTDKEVKRFEALEFAILCDNGYKNINGGWARLEFDDWELINDEKTGQELYGWASCGKDDDGDGHKESDTWRVKYNRKTTKLEGDF